MDFSIIEELRNGIYHPLYLLYGEEEYIIEKTIEVMKQKILDPDWREFNFTVVDLLKQSIDAAIEEAENFPFGEGRRLILAKNAYFLTGTSLRGSVEHSTDRLSSYIEHPAEFSSLVITVPLSKLDERKKIVKVLLNKSRVLRASSLGPDEWRIWIKEQIKEKGIILDEDGLEILYRYLPSHLRFVEHELDKLALYGSGSKITAQELIRIITRTVEGDVFALIEKMINHDFHGGFEIYQELMKQNEEPIKILALFTRQFRIILQSKVLISQGYTQKQIASQLKLHPYAIKIAAEQALRYSEGQLLQIIDRLAEIDYLIKTGQMDKHLALELLLMEFRPQKNER